MKPIPILSILTSCLLMTGCQEKTVSDMKVYNGNKPFNVESVKPIIKKQNDAFMKAHIEKDTALLNGMFAKDAKIFPPNTETVSGLSNIQSLNLEWVNYGIWEAEETSHSIYGNNEYLIDEGVYQMRYGPDSLFDKGKYVNVWKNEDGQWKLFRNIWNSNLPVTESL